jgi:transcriptional regulator with XRE-family HTH domain
MSERDSPIVHQRRLRAELRRLREDARLTQQVVADGLEWSVSKIMRIESGSTNVGITDLRALLDLYRITDEEKIRNLLAAARASKKAAWWTPFRAHIAPQLYAFIGYEASASRIHQFQSTTVPGLLQTPEYVQAISTAFGNDDETVARGVQIRMKRQEIIAADGPDMEFLLDEASLRRVVGSREIMADQLRRIVDAARFSNIKIKVVPFDALEPAGMEGSFTVLYVSASPAEPVVMLQEPLRDVLIRDDPAEAAEYVKKFSALRKAALPEVESIRFIMQIVLELTAGGAVVN